MFRWARLVQQLDHYHFVKCVCSSTGVFKQILYLAANVFSIATKVKFEKDGKMCEIETEYNVSVTHVERTPGPLALLFGHQSMKPSRYN